PTSAAFWRGSPSSRRSSSWPTWGATIGLRCTAEPVLPGPGDCTPAPDAYHGRGRESRRADTCRAPPFPGFILLSGGNLMTALPGGAALLALALAFPPPPPAPEFNLKVTTEDIVLGKGLVNGDVKPEDLKGKVVLLDFWGVRAPQCL